MSAGSISSYPIRTTPSGETPRRRLLSSSSVNVTTRLGKSCFRPFTCRRRSLSWPCHPYSLSMSNTSDTASPSFTKPASSIRARNVLPDPDAPNTPTDRLASVPRSSRIDAASIPCGEPNANASLPCALNTASMSACDAA